MDEYNYNNQFDENSENKSNQYKKQEDCGYTVNQENVDYNQAQFNSQNYNQQQYQQTQFNNQQYSAQQNQNFNGQYQQNSNQQCYYQPQYQENQQIPIDKKNKVVAGVLGILLGSLGIHNFYLGYTGKAIAQLLITVLSFGTLSFVSEIWGLVEGIMLLVGTINVDGHGVPLE